MAFGADLGKVFIEVRAKLDQLRGDFQGAYGAVENETKGFAQRIGGILTPTRLMAAGVGVTTAGAILTKMGDESKQATAQLKQAIDNAGFSMDEFAPKISEVSNQLIKFGFDDEATARSLATLTTATQDPAKALEYMGLVADIAASRHISLESAADKVAKMLAGNNRVFKEFGITVKAGADEQERAAAITELQGRVHGQAAAQADNFSTKVKSLKIQIENVFEAIGSKVGPILTFLGPLISGIGGAMMFLSAGSTAAGAGSTVAAGGMTASGAAAAGATGPVAALGASIWAAFLPVLAVLAAIVVAVLMVVGIFFFLRDVLGLSVPDTVNIMLLLVPGIGTLLAAIMFLARNWEEIWGFIQDVVKSVWNVIKEIFGWIGDRIGEVVQLIKNAVQAVKDAISEIKGAVGSVGSAIFNASPLGLVSNLFSGQAGGTVPGPVGTARLVIAHGGEEIRPYGNLGGGRGGGAPMIVNHYYGSVVTERELAINQRRLGDELTRWGWR